jgi:hypothetical protein
MRITPATRPLYGLAFFAALLALGAAGWELAARQSPGSPLFLGVLPGPIGVLRSAATVAALALLATAPFAAAASERREPGVLSALLYVGAALGLGASVYAAATGMHAVQLDDPRPDAAPVFLAKHGGFLLFYGCLLELARRALFGGEPRSGP